MLRALKNKLPLNPQVTRCININDFNALPSHASIILERPADYFQYAFLHRESQVVTTMLEILLARAEKHSTDFNIENFISTFLNTIYDNKALQPAIETEESAAWFVKNLTAVLDFVQQKRDHFNAPQVFESLMQNTYNMLIAIRNAMRKDISYYALFINLDKLQERKDPHYGQYFMCLAVLQSLYNCLGDKGFRRDYRRIRFLDSSKIFSPFDMLFYQGNMRYPIISTKGYLETAKRLSLACFNALYAIDNTKNYLAALCTASLSRATASCTDKSSSDHITDESLAFDLQGIAIDIACRTQDVTPFNPINHRVVTYILRKQDFSSLIHHPFMKDFFQKTFVTFNKKYTDLFHDLAAKSSWKSLALFYLILDDLIFKTFLNSQLGQIKKYPYEQPSPTSDGKLYNADSFLKRIQDAVAELPKELQVWAPIPKATVIVEKSPITVQTTSRSSSTFHSEKKSQRRKESVVQPPSPSEPSLDTPIQERVKALEAQVAQLKEELAQLRSLAIPSVSKNRSMLLPPPLDQDDAFCVTPEGETNSLAPR